MLSTHSISPCWWRGGPLLLLSTHSLAIGGGGPILPLDVHQPSSLASSSVTPAGFVHKSKGENVGSVEEMMRVVYVRVKKWE